jgi:hypothetical protein
MPGCSASETVGQKDKGTHEYRVVLLDEHRRTTTAE